MGGMLHAQAARVDPVEVAGLAENRLRARVVTGRRLRTQRSPDTSVVRTPRVAKMEAYSEPITPAPMTTRLRSKRAGRVHFAYTLRACNQPVTLLAISMFVSLIVQLNRIYRPNSSLIA